MKDYSERINLWNDYANKLRSDVDFKEIAKVQSESKLVKVYNKTKNEYLINNKHFKVPSRNTKYVDLNDYYDHKKFYTDLIYYLSAIADTITDSISNENYIEFKFVKSDKIRRLSLIHYVFNMLMWYSLFVLEIDVTEDLLFMPKSFNNKEFTKYMNEKIIMPNMHIVTMNEMSELMARVYDIFILICERFGLLLGLSFSMYDILSMWDDKEIYDLNHTKIDNNVQIAEGERIIDENCKRYMKKIMCRKDDNCLKPFLRSGQGVNSKQLREFTISTGFKPTLAGNTINIKPSSNYITDGLRKPTDFIVDASGGRKANVLGTKIDTAGYIQRAFTKSATGITLHKDPNYDCHSQNYLIVTIDNESMLKDYHGRYYLADKNTIKQLNANEDKHLIGKTLKFRSPVFCAGGKDGVCKICYGSLYNQNYGIDVGISSALTFTELFYQLLLSAKHALDTKTARVNMCDEFNLFLYFDEYKIFIKENKLIKHCELIIDTDSIYKNDDNEDSYKNEFIYSINIKDNKNDKLYTIKDNNSTKLYISDYLIDVINSKINCSDVDEENDNIIRLNMEELLKSEEELFFVTLENDELNSSLLEIKNFIQTGKQNKYTTNPSEFVNAFYEMSHNANIKLASIHIEILCKNLIKNAKDIIEPLDFTKPLDDDDILITSIHNSILKSNSVINSLTFERIGIQFRDPSTYKKTGTCPLDRMFI